jgi:hypothetical protein
MPAKFFDPNTPEGEVALSQALRLFTARGSTEEVYREELSRVLAEIAATDDPDELVVRLTMLVDVLALLLGTAFEAMHDEAEDLRDRLARVSRDDFALVLERALDPRRTDEDPAD